MICKLSDQERAEQSRIPAGHVHKWGQWFTDDPRPGVISDCCKRVCKCGTFQRAKWTAWGKVVSEPRTVML